MNLGIKLTLAISAILAVVLTFGAWLIWINMDKWAGERFRDELTTITGYAQEVRLRLAASSSCLEQDDATRDSLSIPVVTAWNTIRKYAESQGYRFRTAAENPRNPKRKPDVFEQAALRAFQVDPQRWGFVRQEEREDGEVLRFAVPVQVSVDCLPCHGDPAGKIDAFGYPREGLKVGDLHGVFAVSAPLSSLHSLQEAQESMRRTFLATGGGAILIAGFAIYLVIRQVTRPLGEMTEVAQSFGEGQLEQRIHSRSNDELGLLATAFNRMAQSLQSYHDTLEQKVEERSRDLEASQQQLMQAGKLASIGELASGVAHELNNPAGIILMRATQLAQELDPLVVPKELQEDVEVIKRQVEKISRIVSGLLTFSRQSSTALKEVDLNEVVRRTVLLIEEIIRNRGVELVLQLSPALPHVKADSAQIEQVLLNLINNALDAMPNGGEITFRTGLVDEPTRGRSVMVEVTDTGTGIPEDHLQRVFDPFFTTKEVGQGTGLGLSISYGIIEEHRGSITVDSQSGDGTCFTLSLPVEEIPHREG